MPDPSRTCHHAACTAPPLVALVFRYDTRQVWLRPLGAEAHPAVYELCADHADRLTVPRGWERIDERGRPTTPAPASAGVSSSDGDRPQPADPDVHDTRRKDLNHTDVVSYVRGWERR